jgi:glycosyltransferase involved in cell wall biosynthesis
MKLLALPSYNEGLPNVMLESMACGTPVIATPVGSIPDVLVDGENGLLIYDNSPTALAEAIIEALQRPQLQRIAVNARMLVETEFRYEKLIKTWERIICDVNDV